MATKKTSIAQALLDAHVGFIVEQLDGDSLRPLLEQEIDALLADAAKLTLDDVVRRESVKQVVQVYAVELELSGGLPELVAEMARLLYSDAIHDRTRLRDLMSDKQFGEILDKLLEMEELRTQLLDEAVSNPLYAALASDLLYHGIRGYLMHSRLAKNIPGASSMMKLGKSMLQHASPGLEHAIEDNLKRYIRKNIGATLKESQRFLLGNFNEVHLREIALDAWHKLKPLKVSSFRKYLSSADIEDFFVITYEYWRQLRKTDYYSALINLGIDYFFDKYGKTRLTKILGEVGIDRDLLVADALRFAPDVIRGLKKKKLLEPLIRRNLQAFYRSGRVEAILAKGA
ncbi:MAG: hypothetical protein JWR16_2519 [Nevskia sp.]|nr:hypothetical protein [Nevskia sp.]